MIQLQTIAAWCLLAAVLVAVPFAARRWPGLFGLSQVRKENERLKKTVKSLESKIEQLESQSVHQIRTSEGFIAQVAHELRSPLTLLLAPLESMLAGNHGSLRRGQKQPLEIMHNNAVRMLQITIGLLDHAAARAGQTPVHREPTDVNALTSAVIADFMPYFDQRELACSFDHLSDDLVVELDRYLYERILFNLLSNAAKFTRKRGSVHVALQHTGSRLLLSVQDTGEGIPERELGNLFKKFHQLNSCASRRIEGTGLGLALVKEFAELLGGSVEVESRLGEGTTVGVTMEAPPAQGDRPAEPVEVRSFTKPLAGAEVIPPAVPIMPAATAFRARILIADDNAEVAQYMQHLLAPLADVRIAEDGNQALDMFYKWQPHVVVADVRMPGMNGIDLCRELKRNEETAGVPVVLLSALTNRETMLQGWESGADDYLFKPFHPTELVTRLQTLISRIHERTKFDERIQSLNKALEQRVSELDTVNEELRWLTKELQSARDHAVAAAQTKSQFLSNMSHEIRTPLNGLIATAELLLQTELSEEQREFVMISRESALVLLETVNDLLDFSRVESGKLSLDNTDFDVLALVEGAAELMSQRAREKHLSLMTHVSHDVPNRLYGDPARLRQVLINLLSNAVKFTEHGEVVCRVTVENQSQARLQVRFSVYDTGIGMPRAMQRTLFEPFYQADSSMTRQKPGAGLGLSIARRLVELMGGSLGVESTQGQGSTFWFVVPLENRADEQAQSAVPETLRNLRVLTVNGPPETQKVIHEYARSWHMTCTSAATASEALAVMGRWHASHKPFDLVLVDFGVSDMHPFTLARYVRNSPDLNATKLMLLTSGEEEGRGERALKCGYAAYLTKPIKQSQLFDCIANVMQGHSVFEPLQVSATEGHRGDETLKLPPNEPADPLILVVEDNAVNQRVARLQLEELGYRVHIVGNGREALEATTRLRYDVILMDCAMPEMDGYEATSRIRKQEALIGRHTPIIALTAHSMPGDRERCLECGMDDYLSKPISKDELGQTIKRWLKFHRGIDTHQTGGKAPGGKTGPGTTTGGMEQSPK